MTVSYGEYAKACAQNYRPRMSLLSWDVTSDKDKEELFRIANATRPVAKENHGPAVEAIAISNEQATAQEGLKFDNGKIRYDLLPVDALDEISKVLTFGAKKYADRNWEKGMRWGRLYRAALGHLFSWWKGEEADPETGLSHLAHAACCCIFLLSYQLRNGKIHSEKQNNPAEDDRP